ncbi:MAG: SMP-30/gluconolactonase/LRE family protein [Thermoanaerobaculia bacterium]
MNRTHRPVALSQISLLALLVALTGCVSAKMYRPDSVEEREDYTLTFIEFDDQGEPWAPAQLERTIQVIDEANSDGKRAVVLLFVHGWQNDASERENRKDDNNVEGFHRLLNTTRQLIERGNESPEDIALIGVYLSWRGRSTDVKLLQPLTFYSRRGAGQRVASVSTTEAILRVMATTKKNPLSTGVVIGHSFGGMIVESALIQALVSYAIYPGAEIQASADMVILVNPASQSMLAKNMVGLLKRNRLQFYREDEDGNRRESPLIVSVTSTADMATGNLYPLALSMKGWSKKFRQYEPTDCSPAPSQKEFYTHTAGHNPVLYSHVIATTGSIDAGSVDDSEMVLEVSVDPKTGENRYTFPGQENLFTIQRLPLGYNDTPYWIMNAPPELIRDHSEIFTYNTLQMIRALMHLSGASNQTVKTIVVREDGVRPIDLIALPDGDLVFLEGSRRFFLLREENSRPFALGCLPAVIQPNTVIGVFYEGERAIVVASAEVQDGKKRKIETNVVAFDFGLVGSESLEWTEIHSDLLFSAAAVDTVENRIYLTRPGELYVASMASKKPKPELLSTFDDSIGIDTMDLDRTGNRLLATDREAGSLYLVDLSSESPTPELVASDLGPITELEFSEADSSLMLIDTAGKKVLAVDCPRESESCSPPRVFAAIPEFEQPIAVARTDDGKVWVGDLGAQSLFAFDADGNLIEVLDSMSGFAE